MKLGPQLWVVVLLAGLLVNTASAQTGELSGTVTDPDGNPIADAPVRAQNEATATDARTRSDASGRYALEALPAGNYHLSVTMSCCDYAPYSSEVSVASRSSTEQDIVLQWGFALSIEGDNPLTVNTEILSRQVVPNAPVPRTADGHPDFSGVWLISDDPYPSEPSLLEWAAELGTQRIGNALVEHPHTRCMPSEPTFPGGAALIAKYVQTPDLLVMLFEDVPGFRQIFLDGRPHPDYVTPSWMGHSIGRWDGETLVVDTVGFNDRGWTGIWPRTEMMRIEERIRRPEFGKLEIRVTVTDPGVFEEPFVRNVVWDLAPQEELMEYVCENNQWFPEASE